MDSDRADARAARVFARVAAAALVAIAGWMTWAVVERADVPVEAVTPMVVAVTVAGFVLVVLGASVLAGGRSPDIIGLSALASLSSVLVVLAIFSIGLLLLPIAVAILYLLVRRASGRIRIGWSLAAGAALAMGLVTVFLVWRQPPLVDCGSTGATTHSRPWSNQSTGSGSSGAMSADGVVTGTLGTPSGRYVYRCENSELTEFRRV